MKYPHEVFSLKIEYIDVIEECGEGPGEVVCKPGQRRYVMSNYRNQGKVL